MNNRQSLLGRSRPGERLSKQDREALEQIPEQTPASKEPTPVATTQAEVPSNTGKNAKVPKASLKYHWTTECPACGFKVAGSGEPKVGRRLARCGRCKLNLFLAGK